MIAGTGPTQRRIIALLAAKPAGLLASELVIELALPIMDVSACLCRMHRSGLLLRETAERLRVYRYRVNPDAPAPEPPKPVKIAPPRSHKKAIVKGEVIYPPGLTVTVCPHNPDGRYTFTPPKGWRGEITKAWLHDREKK